jgi:porin
MASVATGQSKTKSALSYSIAYTSDYSRNFLGGIKKAQTYIGLIDLGVGFDFEKTGILKGAELYVHVQSTHGNPITEHVGDLQVVSNISNGNYTYLYLLNYSQKLGNLQYFIGINDLNAEFHNSRYAGLFINSTFGIMSNASLNFPIAIFPKTALSVEMHYFLNSNVSLHSAVYDGNPGTLENDNYNLDWTINSHEGFLLANEIHFKTTNKKSTFKIGSLYHTANFSHFSDPTSQSSGNFSLHSIVDYAIISKSNSGRGLGAFLQLGFTPDSEKNINNKYFGLGINLFSPFPKQEDDVFGIAFAYAGLSNKYLDVSSELRSYEGVLEITYHAKINDNISIQPNIQYVINPMGTGILANNAFAGILRFKVEL